MGNPKDANLDGVLPGETDFRHLEDKILGGAAEDNRKVWARTAANCFQSAPTDVLVAITIAGEQMWIDRARVTYANHALRTDDLRLMFDIISRITSDRLAYEKKKLGVH